MNEFTLKISETIPDGLFSAEIGTLQINLGRTCNLSCRHCHLECSPRRSEMMPESVMEEILSITSLRSFRRIDITGGAPELHPRFRRFIETLHAQGHNLQVRTNLTLLSQASYAGLVSLFKSCGVSLVGSLPCYLAENVDAQRGAGAHAGSIAALRFLNRAGYGLAEGLTLNLVYNPGGPFLPPRQSELEEIYRAELRDRFGVFFHRLLVLTNMPLGRFRLQLEREGKLDAYLSLLRDAYNPDTLADVMCRRQISVDWDGRIYDCDFNLALAMPVNHGAPGRIEALAGRRLDRRQIVTGNHCFGCTAGAGSSCTGVLTAP